MNKIQNNKIKILCKVNKMMKFKLIKMKKKYVQNKNNKYNLSKVIK